MTETRVSLRKDGIQALGWALFLGTSWTWVIGMVAPTLLQLKWGWFGFALFAIPNVIGAAGMGWTIKRPAESRMMTRRHGTAMRIFAITTILFHFFVGGWIILRLLGPEVAALCWFGTGLMLLVAITFERNTTNRDFKLAFVGFMALLGLALILFILKWIPASAGVNHPEGVSSWNGWDNFLGMATIVLFGFAFCPYLDPTFHRARMATDQAGGRIAFTIGFGVIFCSAILLTSIYSFHLSAFFTEGRTEQLPQYMDWGTMAIGFYMMIQATITTWFHLRELGRKTGGGAGEIGGVIPFKGIGIIVITLLLGAGCLVGGRLLPLDTLLLGMLPGEMIYMTFLSMYSLWFPAYWWWFAMGKNKHQTGSKTKLVIFLLVGNVVWAVFGLAFLKGWYLLLPPAVVVIMGGRYVADALIKRPVDLKAGPESR